ncbi:MULTISPECIES: endopeptidase La [unclassified Clostridium]|uniref:endopeptidase La n=2 Tax=Clostridiaceae TaxID=31979 RepID=UPI001C8C8F0A|nr:MULTISPECIES: endopeptidase La [unclassified Clostridium]MBX9138504.1 endopeptidase La [Clostridium sp. K12(2020)]MBX9145271.1 endopeptidase La [Clostridium sp. K13]MDU2288817.1 endopeptidase La [Clostridium celatum]
MNTDSILLPLIPLRGITIFPNMIIHFDIGREKSIASLEEAMLQEGKIFLVTQKDPEVELPNEKEDMYSIGTICKIKQILKLPKGTTRVLVEGIERATLLEFEEKDNHLRGVIEKISESEKDVETNEDLAFRNQLGKAFAAYIHVTEGDDSKVLQMMEQEKNLGKVTDLIAAYIQLEDEKKQLILETINVHERIEKLLVFIDEEIQIIQIEKEIGNKVKTKLDKSNKEYFLREQIKAIQEELGEDEEKREINKYTEQLKKLKMPKEVREKAEYELSRLKSSNSSDGNSIRSYLDWVVALPWSKTTKDSFDIEKASTILDEEHYGLEEVKERILEYLAVKQYTKSLKGPILCLVGPPGVGKSSIAKSVAKSLNKKFVRISLGGVRDEAEIRGHRRTYIGAMPGRLVYALKEAKVSNPLILLDEIDKLSSDYKGNPADALLEVLDQNQNKAFRDAFMEVEIDLSNVLFITTANSLDTIPRALLDRMEIIQVSGYTYEEKFNIAKNHLLKRAMEEYGVDEKTIKISDNTIKEIVNGYTRESGVRTLERQINKVIRKAITELIKSKKKSLTVSTSKLEKYLGPVVFEFENEEKDDKIGVVTGLAWTAYGGDTLPVEVAVMKGNGKLELTGQLGSVMQESAKAAYSYVRANGHKYGIPEDFYKKNDVHIHVPEGAVPKDGPSAGVTIVTALVSALSKNKVKGNIAMTGEVTLTGRVLAIGGVKEKCLAAHRIGINTIILPKENKKNVDEIPTSIKGKLNLIFADNVEEVLQNALIGVDKIDN